MRESVVRAHVVLPEDLVRSVDHLVGRRKRSEFVAEAIAEKVARLRLIEAARKHGVNLPPRLTIHDLRASFATNYLEENPERFWRLMELLGHISPSSTCLYIRSRGDNRVLSMKQARTPQAARCGFTARVYNT